MKHLHCSELDQQTESFEAWSDHLTITTNRPFANVQANGQLCEHTAHMYSDISSTIASHCYSLTSQAMQFTSFTVMLAHLIECNGGVRSCSLIIHSSSIEKFRRGAHVMCSFKTRAPSNIICNHLPSVETIFIIQPSLFFGILWKSLFKTKHGTTCDCFFLFFLFRTCNSKCWFHNFDSNIAPGKRYGPI